MLQRRNRTILTPNSTGSAALFTKWLVADGLLTAEDLADGRAARVGAKRPLLETLVTLEILDGERLLELLVEYTGLERYRSDQDKAEPELIKRLPYRLARRYGVLPLHFRDSRIRVATCDPTDLVGLDHIAGLLGGRLELCLATVGELAAAIRDTYQADDSAYEVLKHFSGQEQDIELQDGPGVKLGRGLDREQELLVQEANASPIIRLVNLIIGDAIRRGASDIHVEARKDRLEVRFRVDGMLAPVMSLPAELHAPVTARIKVMAGMDICCRRKPQDARISVRFDERAYDLRVSTLPTMFGEKTVMRILDPNRLPADLGQLGMTDDHLAAFEAIAWQPQGIVLIAGPTGSGKTTTLYTTLEQLNETTTNIVTIEDPIEYARPGLNQVEVNEENGLTFAAVLRSVLRQDPNIVLVGEIRDPDTARVATQAALTGHLILSTVHANDTATALTRLAGLGGERSALAEALNGIVAQRLLRRLCTHCRVPDPAPDRQRIGGPLPEDATPYKADGCQLCNYTGYKGRIAVYELLPMTNELRALVTDGASAPQIREYASEIGCPNLLASALKMAHGGVTSLEEVERVIQLPTVGAACGGCGACVDVGFNVCPLCGFTLRTHCGQCGGRVRKGWRVCARCGSAVEGCAGEGAITVPAAPRARGAADRSQSGQTIMVVDDDRIQRHKLVRILEKQGYQTRTCASGEEALKAVAQTRPAALLLDLEMPGISGIDVCQRLRSKLETAQLPILLLTARGEEHFELEGLSAGADDYLTKPVSGPKLLKRLELVLARRG